MSREKIFFFLQILDGVSFLQTSLEGIVITQKVNIFIFDSQKKKKKNYNIVVNTKNKNKKLKGSIRKVKRTKIQGARYIFPIKVKDQ